MTFKVENGAIVSKVCSRSHGQPRCGSRKRAMICRAVMDDM